MVFSRLRRKQKAGSHIPSTGILGEASCSRWLTPYLHCSRMRASVAMLPRSIFPRADAIALSQAIGFPPLHSVERNPAQLPRADLSAADTSRDPQGTCWVLEPHHQHPSRWDTALGSQPRGAKRDTEIQKLLQGEQATWGKIVWQNGQMPCTCFNWKHPDGIRRSSVQGRRLLVGGSRVCPAMTLLSLPTACLNTQSPPHLCFLCTVAVTNPEEENFTAVWNTEILRLPDIAVFMAAGWLQGAGHSLS